jgi:hypothetical protein
LTHAASIRACEDKIARLRSDLAKLRGKQRAPGIKRRTSTRADARRGTRKRTK